MKIKDVKYEVYLQKESFEPPEGWPRDRRPLGKPFFPVMRITTDEGIEGYDFGGAVAWPYPRTISERDIGIVKQVIIGKDPFDREWIWQRLWYLRVPVQVLSAVDIALWDIAGRVAGLPIYKLMGAYRDKIRVYASSWHLPSPQAYADQVIACKERGITAYKLHVNPEIAIEACRAARRAGGDGMVLMLDPYGHYNREQALRVGRELEKLNFYWFEDPIRDYDIDGLITLREKLSIPICAVEHAPMSMYDIPGYLVRRAVDMVRPDTLNSGGITPVKKIADMCDAFGMQCEIHLGGVANLHVECAIKNCEFYEMFWPHEFRYGLKEYPELDNEGYLHVPQKPGLGVEIDWEALGKPIALH